MIKRTWPAILLLGGCASLDNVVGGIANAPDWFKERRVEIRGKGYPKLREVPTAGSIDAPQQRMEVGGLEAEAAREYLLTHPRGTLSSLTPADIEASIRPLRAQLPKIEPKPEGFLTTEEIAALHKELNETRSN